MSEETPTGTPVEEATATGKTAVESTKADTTAILDELGKLGQKVTVALQQVWESEERKRAEEEIRKALRMAGDRIDEVAEDVRASDVTKDLKGQANKAVDAVQQSPITQDLRKSFLAGLRRVNEELAEFLEKEKTAGEKAADAVQDTAQSAADDIKS